MPSKKKNSVPLKVLTDGGRAAKARLARLTGRGTGAASVDREVARIISSVRRHGDRALLAHTKRLDGVAMRARDIEVGKDEIAAARSSLPRSTRTALARAKRRIERFHRAQLERGYTVREPGLVTSMRVSALARVGVYVPGGRAAYPSTVLMNIVPARVAGVADITVVTPPAAGGIAAEVLAAAEMAGATRVLQVGGAQAVAALAYGTETVRPVDKIVGPGNQWVAAAKRSVFGKVDIDMIAGPTEVLVIADSSARPAWVAADMLAQAEHDPMAAALCLTTSRRVAERVTAELGRQLAGLGRRSVAARSIRDYGAVVVVPSLERATELANQLAPEHVEIMTAEASRLAAKVRNAGAIFVGPYATEPLGDYAAGPNHVLPTGGTARFSSPLGVYDFLKRTSIIEVRRRGLEELAGTVVELAGREGLEAHARAVAMRVEDGD